MIKKPFKSVTHVTEKNLLEVELEGGEDERVNCTHGKERCRLCILEERNFKYLNTKEFMEFSKDNKLPLTVCGERLVFSQYKRKKLLEKLEELQKL
jgi:hypothetical protein